MQPLGFMDMQTATHNPPDTTILVLEPDILARMAIAEYLRDCGYRVIEGSKADDVFKVLNAKAPIHIVLTEVALDSDLDGLELARRVRAAQPDVDVIVAAGVGKATDKAGKLCEEGPLQKPYHPQELLKRIHLLREKRRTALEL